MEIASQIAREHGEQRFGLKWNIAELVQDYEVLHGVVLEHLGQVLSERLTYRQAMVIAMVVNGAIGHAVNSFSVMARQCLEQQVRQQQAELRQLTLDLTEAEHHERQRIAAKLHDDLQQLLVAVRMRLSAALTGDPPDRSALETTVGLTDRAAEATRNLAADLYPQVLEHRGVPETIKWMGEKFRQWYGLVVTVERQSLRGCDSGPLPLRRLVYDSARELLFNVVKHAQTDRAWVRIGCDERSTWRIEVEDHGAGSAEMVKAAGPSGSGFGLSSVRRRIEQIGGTVDVKSEPGKGTCVALRVPLDPA